MTWTPYVKYIRAYGVLWRQQGLSGSGLLGSRGRRFGVSTAQDLRLPASVGGSRGSRSPLPSPLQLTMPRIPWDPGHKCASGTFS